MNILLIGNFAPPFEEENLHNISLLKKLEDDSHQCTIINISENPSNDSRFIDAAKPLTFIVKLIRHGWRKDVIHFSTKGYLRVGLLKLMISTLTGLLFRARTVLTIHSELFSMQGQMRSPFGGRQTLFTSFTAAGKIICHDRDTYDVASMYMKKSNFELIPSFIYVPDEVINTESPALKKLKEREKVIIFSSIVYPSFVFEIIKELLSNYPLPADLGIVLSFAEKSSSKLRHVLEETGGKIRDQLIFIDSNDLKGTLLAYSKAEIIVRPLSCEGTTYYKDFAISAKKLMHHKNLIEIPGGLLFLKEGDIAAMCVCIINTMLCVESGPVADSGFADSYDKILKIYAE